MQVIVFASQKGGTGKTTLAGQLAVAAEQAGHGPVALIDCDPQGSLTDWWKNRADPQPSLLRSSARDIEADLVQLIAQGHRLALVDTPPADPATLGGLLPKADLVVVPCRPSPHDLRAVAATVDIIESRHKPLAFVVNCATPGARISADAAVALSQHGTVAATTVHQRVDYAASMIDGRTVMDMSEDGASAAEIGQLWAELSDRLARLRDNRKNAVSAALAAADIDALGELPGAVGQSDSSLLSLVQAHGRAARTGAPRRLIGISGGRPSRRA